MAFDERDPQQILDREAFKDLWGDRHLARMVAHDLYTHGKAICEIKRDAGGRIVGFYQIDVATIKPLKGSQYEHRIGNGSRWIDADKLIMIRLVEHA